VAVKQEVVGFVPVDGVAAAKEGGRRFPAWSDGGGLFPDVSEKLNRLVKS
jgi:hypothetical protein